MPAPPHNPCLRELIRGKRAASGPRYAHLQKAGFGGWQERGYLPHRDDPGLTQFVTFRLADSFPAELRSEWIAIAAREDDRERRKRLERYLDVGHGNCWLRQASIASLVVGALKYFHGKRYALLAWVVMPNHVHVLFEVQDVPMSRVVESWKKYSAHEANRVLNRTGRFWSADYWDTYMRNSEQTLKARQYVENNPVKAGLVATPEEWAWSSARLRDPYGRLLL